MRELGCIEKFSRPTRRNDSEESLAYFARHVALLNEGSPLEAEPIHSSWPSSFCRSLSVYLFLPTKEGRQKESGRKMKTTAGFESRSDSSTLLESAEACASNGPTVYRRKLA